MHDISHGHQQGAGHHPGRGAGQVLRPGSRLAFVPTADGYEIHHEATSIKDLKGAVPPPTQPVSIDAMNEAVGAGAAADAR